MKLKILLVAVIIAISCVSPAITETSAQTQSNTETVIIGGTLDGRVIFLNDNGEITNEIQIGDTDEAVRGVAIADNGYYAAVNRSLYFIQNGEATHIHTHNDFIVAISSIGSEIAIGDPNGNVKRIDSSGNIIWEGTGYSGIQDIEPGIGDTGEFLWVSSKENGNSQMMRYNWTNGNSQSMLTHSDGPGRHIASISDTQAAMTTSHGSAQVLKATAGSGYDNHGRVLERFFPQRVTENDGILYIGLSSNNEDGIYAYNHNTRTVLYQTPDNTYNNIKEIHYANGSLYTASKSSIQKVNPDDGSEIWNASGINGVPYSLRAETVEVTHAVSGNVTDSDNNPIENASVTIQQNGTEVANATTNSDGQYSAELGDGSYTAIFTKEDYGTVEKEFTISGDSVTVSVILDKVELEIEVQKWMKPNSTQTYKGIYVPTNGYDIVTSELNVTSDNTSVIEVSEANNTLIAQSGVNTTANVTFQYEQLSVTKQIAVSHRTLENIHFLPSTQWFNAIMGIDDPQTEFGLGSEMQWIFVAILLSSLLASLGNSEWIGLATTIISMSLLWMLEYVSLGMVLATLFFGLFLAFTLLDIPRNERAEITVEDNNPK